MPQPLVETVQLHVIERAACGAERVDNELGPPILGTLRYEMGGSALGIEMWRVEVRAIGVPVACGQLE